MFGSLHTAQGSHHRLTITERREKEEKEVCRKITFSSREMLLYALIKEGFQGNHLDVSVSFSPFTSAYSLWKKDTMLLVRF